MEEFEYPDLMVDVETTGLQPHAAAIIQIGAVPFNYQTGAIDSKNMFKRSLTMPRTRYWTDDTQKFWMVDNAEVYWSIMEVAEPYRKVIQDFYDYAVGLGDVCFWSKGHLDWSIIDTYFLDAELPMPFNFRQAKDMRSFIAGLHGDPIYCDPEVEKVGNHHDALHDCLTQLKQLFKAKAETCQSTLVSD